MGTRNLVLRQQNDVVGIAGIDPPFCITDTSQLRDSFASRPLKSRKPSSSDCPGPSYLLWTALQVRDHKIRNKSSIRFGTRLLDRPTAVCALLTFKTNFLTIRVHCIRGIQVVHGFMAAAMGDLAFHDQTDAVSDDFGPSL